MTTEIHVADNASLPSPAGKTGQTVGMEKSAPDARQSSFPAGFQSTTAPLAGVESEGAASQDVGSMIAASQNDCAFSGELAVKEILIEALVKDAVCSAGGTGVPPHTALARPTNLQDTYDFVETKGLLPPDKCVRLSTDIKVLADCIVSSGDRHDCLKSVGIPADIPCDPKQLRPLLKRVKPARFWKGKHRWSSVRSSLKRMLILAGCIPAPLATEWVIGEPWLTAMATLHRGGQRGAFQAFARFCTAKEIPPASVSLDTFEAYRTYFEYQTIELNVNLSVAAARNIWGLVVKTVDNWPGLPLPAARRRGSYAHPTSLLHPNFVLEMTSYLETLANPGLFNHRFGRARAPATIVAMRAVLTRAASTLINSGCAVSEVNSIASVVKPQSARIILTDQHDRLGEGKGWPPGAVTVANYLKMAAKHCPSLTDLERLELKELCSVVRPISKGMKRKNRDLLEEYDDPQVLYRWATLPEECFKLADQLFKKGKLKTAAVLHQRAIGLAIIQIKPLRRSDLVKLDLSRHFKRDTSGRPIYFRLRGDEDKTKTGQDIDARIPQPLGDRILIHIERYMPIVNPRSAPYLFPGKFMGHMHPQSLAVSISQMVKDRVGAEFFVHFARHLSATLLVEDDPRNIVVAQRLLGHSDPKVTARQYAATRTRVAQSRYAEVLAEKCAKGKLNGGPRGKKGTKH